MMTRTGSRALCLHQTMMAPASLAVIAACIVATPSWAQSVVTPQATPTQDVPVSYTHLTLPTKRIV